MTTIKTDFSQFKGPLVERITQAAQVHRDASVVSAHLALTAGGTMGQPEARKIEFHQHLQAEATLLEVVNLLVATD